MRRAAWSLSLVVLLGCGTGTGARREGLEAESPTRTDGSRIDATRAEREAAHESSSALGPIVAPAPAPVAPAPAPVMEPPTDMPSLTLTRLEGTQLAEDGAGGSIESERSVAIDLRADAFPPRALDPVLEIGSLRFTHYRHPRIGVLRFVVASPELLVPGSVARVVYDGDTSFISIVSESLVVPAEVLR